MNLFKYSIKNHYYCDCNSGASGYVFAENREDAISKVAKEYYIENLNWVTVIPASVIEVESH